MIELNNVNVSFRSEKKSGFLGFGAERKQILHNICLKLERGECLGILGESGSGKSTMGRVLCGLLKPDSGDVFVEGEQVYQSKKGKQLLREKMSIVFQDYTTSTNPRFRIQDIIEEGMYVKERKTKKKINRKEECSKLLQLVGLDDSFKNRFPHELSGGQLQRVCIARAIACAPEFILFDEAVSSLDAHTQVQIMDLLLELKEKLGLTYIFITHDLTSVTYFCDRVIFLKSGTITEEIEVENIANVKDEYAKQLLHSIIDFVGGEEDEFIS